MCSLEEGENDELTSEKISSLKIERTKDFQLTHDYLIQICLLGDSNVGKTSLLTRFCDSIFKDHYSSTIGLDFRSVALKINGKIIKVQIWDTAGEERFKSLASNYFRNSHGFIFVYDILNMKSFENVDEWVNTAVNINENYIVSYLIGNKCDNEEKREVKKSEGQDYAKKKGFLFKETSAKDDKNVKEIFFGMIYKIVKEFENNKGKYNHDECKHYVKLDKKSAEINTVRPRKRKCDC